MDEYVIIPKHFRKNGGEHKHPDYLNLNPQGLLPTIQDGSHILSQSIAIIEYLDEKFPEPALIPKSPADRSIVRWLYQLVSCEIPPPLII
jgi:maleylpyruvate isomerase